MRLLFLAAPLFLASLLPARAQFKAQTPAGEAHGPWIFATIGVGKNENKVTALKGLAIKVGEHGEAAVAYDLDLCRIVGVWTGGKFTTPMNLMSRGEYPTALGEQQITYESGAGFELGPSERAKARTVPHWVDPRSEPFGPLPEVRYRGMYVCGEEVVLKWDLGGVEILELPGYYEAHGFKIFTRHLRVAPHDKGIVMLMESGQHAHSTLTSGPLASAAEAVLYDGRSYYWFPPSTETSVIGFQYPIPTGDLSTPTAAIEWPPDPDFSTFLAGGPPRWPETVETQGELSKTADKDAYVVDTIKLPDPNPWNAPMFTSGFDFFPDGRAAVCTFHGDVFIVSGIDGDLQHVKWKRFATGLYHPLGLKIVKNEIYVTCRDGITRLRDLDGDGEVDFYEAFNWDIKVTKSFHEFVFDLQTDPAGNFYFAKAGPVKNGGPRVRRDLRASRLSPARLAGWQKARRGGDWFPRAEWDRRRAKWRDDERRQRRDLDSGLPAELDQGRRLLRRGAARASADSARGLRSPALLAAESRRQFLRRPGLGHEQQVGAVARRAAAPFLRHLLTLRGAARERTRA